MASKIKLLFLLLLLITLSIAVIFEANAKDKKNISKSNKGNYVKIIYFHGDIRCTTCKTIEKYSKETINSAFKDLKKNGRLKMTVINYDKKKNNHYKDKYGLYSQALIIMLYKDGKQIEWKNCPKVWEYVNNRAAFGKYVEKEVKSYLGKI